MTFALGTFSTESGTVVGLVAHDRVFALEPLRQVWRGGDPALEPNLDTATVLGLIQTWDQAFPLLQELAAFALREGSGLKSLDPACVRYRPPIQRPGKILHSAANFRDHISEMAAYNAAAGNANLDGRYTGVKSGARPYLFLKAASALNGPYDDIELPDVGESQIDWEAELAVVIGRPGRAIRARHARDHIAGYMAANDVTRRDTLWREDRKNFRTDWLASKSSDGFAPMGPLFVPAAFVRNPANLRITLSVNGVLKQDGSTGDMIFSAEEQIEYASRFMSLESGDIFVTGTVGGVGQATGEFLNVGDVMETRVAGVGRMCNRIVASKTK